MADDVGEPHLITSRKIITGREPGSDQTAAGYVTAPAALIADFQQTGEPNGWRPVVLPLGDEHGQPLWREHPEHGHAVDVAALPLRFDPVAERVDLIEYDHHFETARLDVASELFVIGFPSAYNPQLVFTMLGIWMRGTIAWPPDQDWCGLPCTLLDCRTRTGQAGSPVIFWADASKQYINYRHELATGPAWSLVGLYGGRIDPGTDIGVVWKKSAIEEVVVRGRAPTAPADIGLPPEGLRAVTEEAARSARPVPPQDA